MLILGIETSCDETGAAVVQDGSRVLSNHLASQREIHQSFGGVVPELACRRHIEVIDQVVAGALRDASISLSDIDAVAVTAGPGLFGALVVGVSFAKSLAYALGVPLVAVNHLEGHILSVLLEGMSLSFPAVSLVVSGGHTNLYYMPEFGQYHLVGATADDAAGEAFDKAAKMLGLGYPGGPIIDELAAQGKGDEIPFPRPFLLAESLGFSFSGLKTALRYYLERTGPEGGRAALPHVAASFQRAIVDVLVGKTVRAIKKYSARSLIVSGGVAANSLLRDQIREKADSLGVLLQIPSPSYCTDNGAMIAAAGYYHCHAGRSAPLDLTPHPDLALGTATPS